MVKTIAQNVDELLARYNTKDQVSYVKSDIISAQTNTTNTAPPSADMTSLIQRINKLETNSNKNKRRNMGFTSRKQDQCSYCIFINQQLGSSLRTDHPSKLCGKKKRFN